MKTLEDASKQRLDVKLPDEEVVRRVLDGETELYEILMRRYNQRLFRAARAIVRNDGDAEVVMQDAYVSAYLHLGQFAKRASFATWITKIVINEALARLRQRNRFVELDAASDDGGVTMIASQERGPEQNVFDRELKSVLENAIDALPDKYRSVFVLREVDRLDTSETAECLGISEEAVKVRLHRARNQMRKILYSRSGAVINEAFQLHLVRCDRVVEAVFERIRALKN